MTLAETTPPILADPFYQRLKRLVIQRTGLSYYETHESDLMQKVQSRLSARGLPGCEAYWKELCKGATGQSEFDLLIAELTIGETHFFRHREMFDAIREIVLPNVVERNRDCRRIRVWSAGCSIGAEAYSMSILIHEFLGDRAAGWDVSILGTDINREYLAQAQRGEFNDWALRSLSDELRMRYFERHNNNWRILPIHRRGVSFQYHNLVTHQFPSPVQNIVAFDVVLCRNVMIYFSDKVNHCLVTNLHHSLADEGWLAVGHAEPQGTLFDSFRRIMASGAVLYQKPSTTPAANATIFHRKNGERTCVEATPRGAESLPSNQAIGHRNNKHEDAPASASPTRNENDRSLSQIRALADRGELEQAAHICVELLDETKLCPKVHFQFALLMEQTGRIDEAEQWLRKALYLDRNHVLAHFYLGLTHVRKSDAAAARRALQNVLTLTEHLPADHHIEEADEMQVSDLRQLTQMQLSLLKDHERTNNPGQTLRTTCGQLPIVAGHVRAR